MGSLVFLLLSGEGSFYVLYTVYQTSDFLLVCDFSLYPLNSTFEEPRFSFLMKFNVDKWIRSQLFFPVFSSRNSVG